MNEAERAVEDALRKYNEALNASSTEAVMALYAEDGVFMPQNSPSSVGATAVRQAYDAVWQAITLKVKFNVAEIRQLGPEWVMARTNSAGTNTFHATGEQSSEANQELFLFQQIEGAWKIARYCFATTNPPKA